VCIASVALLICLILLVFIIDGQSENVKDIIFFVELMSYSLCFLNTRGNNHVCKTS
jgi:hypothetical protein